MKKRNIVFSRIISTVIAIIVTLSLFCYFIFAMKNCSSYFDEQTLSYSLKLTEENASAIRSNAGTSIDKIKAITSKVSSVTGFQQIDSISEQLVRDYGITCLQFYYDGHAEYRYGEGVGSSTSDEFTSMLTARQYAVSHVFTDDSLGTKCFAMYGPVDGNPEIDGVVAYFATDDVFTTDYSNNELLQFACVAEKDGSILDIYSKDGFKTDVSHNIYTYLANINQTKSSVESLEENCKNGIPSSYEISIDNNDYIISDNTITLLSTNYVTINIYKKSDLLDADYPLYNQLFASGIALTVFCIVILIIYTVTSYSSVMKINELDDVDPVLGCNSYGKFVRRANEILSNNRRSGYAMVYLDINKFTFVRENFGSEMCDNILRQVSTIINKLLSENETYGHIVDDRFAIMMHCANIQDFTNRIKIISALVSSYQLAKSNNFNITLSIGVYKIDREKNYSVQEMLDRASVAKTIHKQSSTEPFVLYNPSIRAAYIKEAEIESKMESSLKNNEFRVFYQPKYNIQKDCIDGAEALVRWYDVATNSYTSPDNFVPLFEVNGFIAKLDRYVFKSVCKFLHEQTERGEKTVPISVNVSRVSATKFDFLSYYIKTKADYGIPDGYLMLEFTESFAYENYQTINSIVTELRKNGFKCSIDDFGSGYSSFEILKELSMDELKLDKMFLNPSSDRKKDTILLKSIIELGNSFNMKVTQEGVESLEQLKQLESFGCNVIQGYYYSKPIPTSDFIEFINNSTSMNSVINNVIEKRETDKKKERAIF